MRRIVVFFGIVLMWAGAGAAWGGEIIGQVSDPCDPSIDPAVDITSTWVEKDGTNLTFVIEVSGPVPAAENLPGDDDTITYIWFMDADGNRNTGQNPGGVGSEFNIRAVIGRNFGGGFVDVTGNLPGGGSGGTVQVNGNRVGITVAMSQVGMPNWFQWQADAGKNIGGVQTGNGLTTRTLARASKYGILYEGNAFPYMVETTLTAVQDGTSVLELSDSKNDVNPLFLSLHGQSPAVSPDVWQVWAEGTGHANFMHLRNAARLTVKDAAPGISGQSQAKTISNDSFTLGGPEGSSGPVPHGTFALQMSHDYRLLSTAGNIAKTFNQVLIAQGEAHKLLWTYEYDSFGSDIAQKLEKTLDLADYGLEFGVTYSIDTLLVDDAIISNPIENGEAVSDSSFLAKLVVTPLAGDVNGDGAVNLTDMALLAENWLASR